MNSGPEDMPGGARLKHAAAAGLLVLSAAAVWGGTAAASDSGAELATGGLVLARSDGIEVRSEEIYISPRQVRISYRFRNASPGDLTTVVAFPMPDITVTDAAADIPVPSDDPYNLLGFSARVDGAPVKARVVQKVIARGVDRTADLERMQVPLAPHLRSTDKALGRLQPADADVLAQDGLAAVEAYAAGAGMRRQLSPRWTLKTTHYWEQTFPAGKEVAIEHRYKPSVGRSLQTRLGDPESMKDGWFSDYMRKYCIGRHLLDAVAHARKAARTQHGAPFAEERISYLLSTGASRAGPVGEFRLVVDTGAPTSLVSFCAHDIEKVGPTRYQVRKADFQPTQDLHVLILKRTRGR